MRWGHMTEDWQYEAPLNRLLATKGRSNSLIRTTFWVTATTSLVVSISSKPPDRKKKKKKKELEVLHLQRVLKPHEHTHWQRNRIYGEHHWVQKQEWPLEYTSCRSARDTTGKRSRNQSRQKRKQIHLTLSTYRRTVSFLEHEGLQLELDLVFLGSRHEAWTDKFLRTVFHYKERMELSG